MVRKGEIHYDEKIKIFTIASFLTLSFLLIGCASPSTDSASQNAVEPSNENNHYEYRIIEDPSTGILTVFYEKDGNLYYKQITEAHYSGDNITLDNSGWTKMEPPTGF